MTDPEWTVFVEGSSDQHFLKDFLRHLDIACVTVERIGGGISKLPIIRNRILQTHREGKTVAVVVDADSSVANSREELRRIIERDDLPIGYSFLLPNDEDPGCLETLLEQTSVEEHRGIYECFRKYEECLSHLSEDYLPPTLKARIYAYCWANRIKTHPRERDYRDSAYWNLNAAALDPLEEFLRDLVSE